MVSMAELMVCNMCDDDDTRVKIPYDEVGIELMKAHLSEAHNVKGGW
jgi:hypothetical protein